MLSKCPLSAHSRPRQRAYPSGPMAHAWMDLGPALPISESWTQRFVDASPDVAVSGNL
jgi:hypothetical protein